MEEWRAMESLFEMLKQEYRQMEVENSRLLMEIDAKERELNHLRQENIILRGNQ